MGSDSAYGEPFYGTEKKAKEEAATGNGSAKLYMVMAVCYNQTVSIECGGMAVTEREIAVSWADGMVGACPVFDNLEDATKYANGNRIIAVEVT